MLKANLNINIHRNIFGNVLYEWALCVVGRGGIKISNCFLHAGRKNAMRSARKTAKLLNIEILKTETVELNCYDE